MTESLHAYMRVGIIHFMAFPTAGGPESVQETVRAIALDDYFDAVELTRIGDTETREKVKSILEVSGIDVAFGGQPILLSQGLNINSLDESARQKAIAAMKAGIDEAVEIGAEGFAFLSGAYEEVTKEESYQALISSTKELCAYAKEKGDIKVVHEVFDYDIDKRSLVGPVALAKRYAEEICSEFDNFGLMVDLSHIPLLHESPKESILPIKDYLVHAHMGNCVMADPALPGYGDQHPRFGFPGGENHIDELVEYLQVLKDIGYLNKEKPPILSFEVKPINGEDPYLTIANSKRVLNKAWAKVR